MATESRDLGLDYFLYEEPWYITSFAWRSVSWSISKEHTSSFLINIRAALSRNVGEDSKVQRVSSSWLQQLFVFFFESQRRHFSRSSAGKDDLVCLRVGLSSIDSRGTLVAGPPPSSSSSRQCRDISNFPGAQESLGKVDSNTLTIKKVQKEHVPETESDCKTRSNFRALFYRVSRAFGCDQNVHVALVTRGARQSTRNLPYVTITHSYVVAFFVTGFPLLFRSHFCKNCSFTRRYQHDSVLELFPHFGRRGLHTFLGLTRGRWKKNAPTATKTVGAIFFSTPPCLTCACCLSVSFLAKEKKTKEQKC